MAGAGDKLAPLLSAKYFGQPKCRNTYQVAALLISIAGNLPPKALSPAHITEAEELMKQKGLCQNTLTQRCAALRNILRYLWAEFGAPKLDQLVTRHPTIRPRNITATRAEIDAILAAAHPHIRLWLLLCSDLALRSGTARALNPENYDPENKTIRCKTKFGGNITIPATAEIAAILDTCDLSTNEPFVRQLWRRYPPKRGKKLRPGLVTQSALHTALKVIRERLGITKHITPHDLRRTTAVAMLQQTHDLRDVQALLGHRGLPSTIWYLDHDLRPIKRSNLEIIKRPAWRKEQIA